MMNDLINKLYEEKDLTDKELLSLIQTDEYDEELYRAADKRRRESYGDEVYVRGLIEFTNCCKNDCYYCGIRKRNNSISRFRMTNEKIMSICEDGYKQGFRTFVLQGADDPYYTDEKVCGLVSEIKKKYPDCAVTLSIGEKSRESYQAFHNAGVDRYLLRHETATMAHYRKLHPIEMNLKTRKQCLYDLKETGFQVGAGFMVGSPYQKPEYIINDIRFLQELSPDMIGIGPFISQCDTPFSNCKNGSLTLTLRLISILRLMFPYALIPATTALGTIHPEGRELGLKAGANVIMPNITPPDERKKYILYDNIARCEDDSLRYEDNFAQRVKNAGYRVVTDIGNVKR